MVAIKPLSDIVSKWTTVTPGRAPFYESGVRAPTEDWATEAAEAEGSWSAGVQDAIRGKRYSKGVKEAGTAKWQAKSISKGVPRYGPGVTDAGPDYEKGFGPFHEVIARTTLPARGPKGDPKNIERVRVLAAALHKKKVGGGGGA